MRRKLLSLLLLLLASVGCGSAFAQTLTADGFVEGVVRVKLQREVASRISGGAMPMSNGVVTTGVTPLDRVGLKVKAVSMKRLFPYSPKFEERHKAAGLDLWYEVRFDGSSVSPMAARNLYKSVPGVQHAEGVKPVKMIGGERFRPISPDDIARAAKAAASPFNDPLLADQWHYQNNGTLPGSVAGADANVWQAWAEETGSSDVLVAIVDGGFQWDHPDLKQNAYVNEAELNGKAGADDDGNGYVDDVYGYNFVINSSDVSPHSHGTHVAGTVGAVNNNGVGVAGVAGGNGGGGVKMLLCQVFDNRSGVEANNAGALVYAADMGASIAQCSWGWSTPDYVEQSVLEAIDYFTAYGGGERMRGGLCIFANGNTGDEGDYFPACYDKVVAVGAMDAMLQPASYSTHGDWVDVTAPGGDMDYGQKFGVLSTLPNSTYGYNEGTSMACPHVSGIAALVLSKYGSKEFTNENLRQQLISSVNDFYTANPQVQGKYGSGYIDAYKALQMGSGAAPEAVADFRLTPSQDNILIEWTIPEAEEKSVDHHVVYYSTEPFTAGSDLDKLNSVSVDTKFYSSGDLVKHELGGLTPLTTYYVAIKAVNRYGNSSALSEVITAKTNAGPEVTLSKTSLSLNVDASASQTATDEFTINNVGEGILKYTMSAATAKAPSITTSALNKVTPGKIVPASKTVEAYSVNEYPVVSADYMKDDYPVNFTYMRGLSAYIGDSDLEMPNAQAQYFYVDPQEYPDGFNFTHVNVGGVYGDNPVIEIYDGASSISKASLLQEVGYSWFAYNNNIQLAEQIFFAPGSAFWVVVKFPAGQSNPLGAGRIANGKSVKQYSFYSNDNGATWTQLSEVLREGNMADVADSLTWAVKAVSQNPDWSSVLCPEPMSGEVRPGATQTVTMKNDGQKMVNGTYSYNLYLNTNETAKPKQKLAVTMKVTGNKPSLSSAKVVDFGDLLVGKEKTLSVEIANTGYGAFGGKWGSMQSANISCSSDQFSVPTYASNFPARSTNKINVTFKPTKSGSLSGNVTLKSHDGTEYSFIVRGVASMPAKAVVSPTSFELGDLEVGGDAVTKTFTVKNEGEYPLQYVFPKFTDETIEDAGRVHKFGYTYVSNLDGGDGFEYDGNPALGSETDITSQFNDSKWQSEAVELGFKFPFYGTEYTQVYVSSHGGVMMQTKDGNISCMVPTGSCVEGLGYISAYANSGHLSLGASSKISYGRQDGKFTVKFKDVLTAATDGNGAYTPISFHLSLCSDGSVEIFYDDYNPGMVFNDGKNVFVGVSDIGSDDPFVVTDVDLLFDENITLYENFKTGTAVKILAPSKSMIASLSSVSGMINIGESKEITVTAKAGDDLYAGALTNNLFMLTNDPVTPGTNIVFKANITGDGLKPAASLDASELDFGEVFRTSDAVRTILLSNTGKSRLSVESVVVKDGKFVVAKNISEPFVIEPGTGKDLAFTLPTENEGEVSDEIVITYGDGTTATLPVRGKVIGVPQWAVTPESIETTTPYGVNVDKTLTVSNGGNETLEFNVEPSDWVAISDQTVDEKSSIDYVYKSATDYKDIKFDWVDITKDKDAKHQDLTYYLDKTDYYTVELPFEFPFYGKKYKKMYIYSTGFVSFSEHTDYKEFPEPPAGIPTTETFYNNIIAPFWGNHSMGAAEEDGTYYKEEGDHVVVSFVNYGNSMMLGMSYQVLLYKDGRYKFQYKLDDNGMMNGVFGLSGIQDETGKRGVQLPDQCINPGNAVEFYPVKSFSVPAGASLDIPVELRADSLAGLYEAELTINTNVPTQPVVKLPVKMDITGEPDAVFPEKVGGEAVADWVSLPTLIYDFEVVNNGSRAFKVTDVAFNPDPDFSDPDFDWETYVPIPAYLLVYATYTDDFTGESMTGWTRWMPGMELEVGKEPLKFQIQYMDMGTPTKVELPITMTIDGLAETERVIPFELNLTEAPVMEFDRPEIVIDNVADDYTGTDKMVIRNTGLYGLEYSLRLDPNGVDEQPAEGGDGGGIAPGVMNVHAQALTDAQRSELFAAHTARIVPNEVFEGFPYDVPPVDCNNLLYYPILDVEQPASLKMGTGSDNIADNFLAATRYTAPEQGFNLTHLYFVGTVGDLENVDIEASVIGGSDVTSERVIGHGKLRVEKEEPIQGDYFGVPRMLEFDKPVYINPNDTFYVVLKYPAGYPHSALLSQKSDRVREGRYMAWLRGNGWIDVGTNLEQQYGSFGYFMTCVEKDAGKPWIKLLDTETSGEVAVGGEKEIKFEINANSTYFDKNNTATLVIKSNDPERKLVNYHITLNKNAAPVVTLPEGTTTVAEGAQADMAVSVADSEGDAFTVRMSDESGIASVTGHKLDDGTDAEMTDGVVSVPAGKTLSMTVTLAPGYGTAGAHSFVVSVADENGNTADKTANYNVEFTNRAPEFVGQAELSFLVGETSAIYAYNTMFTDPDDDAMTYDVTVADDGVARLLKDETGFVVSAMKEGTTTIIVTATDASGNKTQAEITVNVTTATGIGGVTGDGDLTVDGSGDGVSVTVNTDVEKASFRVYDTAGRLVGQLGANNLKAGSECKIGLEQSPRGVYHLVATLDGKTVNKKFAKK